MTVIDGIGPPFENTVSFFARNTFIFLAFIHINFPMILFYLACFLMPIEPHFKMKSKLTDNLKVILKNKNYILVTCMQGIASIAWIMVGAKIFSSSSIGI